MFFYVLFEPRDLFAGSRDAFVRQFCRIVLPFAYRKRITYPGGE